MAAELTPNVWTRQRLEIRNWLHARAPSLAELYEGLVDIYCNTALPGRIRYVAHGVREIGNRLPDSWGTCDKKRVDYPKLTSAVLPLWEAAGLPVGSDPIPIPAIVGAQPLGGEIFPVPVSVVREVAALLGEHKTGKQRNLSQSHRVFDGLSRDVGGAIGSAKLTIELWHETREWFVGLVHEPVGGGADPVEETDRRFGVFEAMLHAMAAKFFGIVEIVEALLKEEPTPENVDKVISSFSRGAVRMHFFERLNDPRWLRALADVGCFKDPPVDEYWPEIVFLLRMTNIVPDEVVDIVTQLPETGNDNISMHIVQIALALPPHLAKQLVPQITAAAARESFLFINSEKLPELISYLAKKGEVESALSIARECFSVRTIETLDEIAFGPDGPSKKHTFPRTRMDLWHYQRAVNHCLVALVETAPAETLKLFAGILIEVSKSYGLYKRGERDNTHIWGREVGGVDENSTHDIARMATAAVAEAAILAIRDGKLEAADILGQLKAFPCKVFQYLPLHVLARVVPLAADQAMECLSDLAMWAWAQAEQPFGQLVRVRFGELPGTQQHRVLDAVAEGPDVPGYAELLRRLGRPEPCAEDLDYYRKSWIRDRLRWVPAEFLRPGDKELKGALEADLGDDRPVYRNPFYDVPSPKTPEELGRMTPEEVISFCKRYQPDGEFGSEAMSSLAQDFSISVKKRPTEFSQVAAGCIGLHWRYIRAFLWGIGDDVRQGPTALLWGPMLELFYHVIDQLQADAKPDVDAARNGSSRNELLCAIADVMRDGFANQCHVMAFEFRERAWELLSKLMSDPDPMDGEEFQGDFLDRQPFEIRGRAMHAVMVYAIWVKKQLADQGADLSLGFENMREVKAMLDEHLQVEKEPSLPVRSVYGHFFPWLLDIDPGWATEAAPRIFSKDNQPYWKSAWKGYIRDAAIFDPAYPPLRENYVLAIEGLDVQQNNERDRYHDEERLGVHLLSFYWRGVIALEPDGILAKYMEKASLRSRRQVMALIGSSIANSPASVDADTRTRLARLWEARLQTAKASPMPELFYDELATFGGTFALGKFELDWSIPMLLEVLEFAGYVDQTDQVIYLLETVAAERTGQVVDCIHAIVKASRHRERWRYWTAREQMSVILELGLASEVLAIANKAEDVIHIVGERGDATFQPLLGKRQI